MDKFPSIIYSNPGMCCITNTLNVPAASPNLHISSYTHIYLLRLHTANLIPISSPVLKPARYTVPAPCVLIQGTAQSVSAATPLDLRTIATRAITHLPTPNAPSHALY